MPSLERRRRHNEKLLRDNYRTVLEDPTATPEQKLRAADGLRKMESRRVDRKVRDAKVRQAEPEAAAPEVTPEQIAEALVEIQARIDASERLATAFRAQRRAYFNSHPDRAGEVMAAIGSAEFVRITS